MKTVAFFSTRSELEILRKRDDFGCIKLIALTAEADFALDDFPNRKVTIEDYYCEKKLNEIGNNSLDKVKKICDVIDSEYLTSKKMFSCSDVYMYVKSLYDQLLINHTFCKAVSEKENPDKIILFNLQPLSETILADLNDDLLINFIYYFFTKKNQIKTEILTGHTKFEKKKKINTASLMLFIKKTLFKLQNVAYRLANFKKPAIYMLQPYDYETCKNLRRCFKVYWKNIFYKNHYESAKNDLPYCKELDTLLTFDECSYHDLVSSKINFTVKILADDFIKLLKTFIILYAKKNIKVVIAASGQSLEILAGIKAANICKIPMIWGQHGGFYGYAEFPIMKYLSCYYTHYFLYTDAISAINNGVQNYAVSDSKLLKLYATNRANKN